MRFARTDRPEVIAAAATLLIAAASWMVLVVQAEQVNAAGAMAALAPFMATWVLIMAAMILPGAVPFLTGIAALSREDWPLRTAVAAVSYLAVWAALGIVAYVVVQGRPPAWMGERVAGHFCRASAGRIVRLLQRLLHGCYMEHSEAVQASLDSYSENGSP